MTMVPPRSHPRERIRIEWDMHHDSEGTPIITSHQSLDMIVEDIPKPDISLYDNTYDNTSANHVTWSPDSTHQGVARIQPKDLAAMLRGEIDMLYDEVIMMDCRFKYEFQAGHIIGARSVATFADLKRFYDQKKGQNCLIVFHCEFSQNRGPSFAAGFREHDRFTNLKSYPNLSFPNVAILDGGFKRFFSEYPDLCTGTYLPMRDPTVDRCCLRKHHNEFLEQQRLMRSISALPLRPEKSRAKIRISCSQPVYTHLPLLL